MNEIAFTKVSGPYGWLGNMSPHSIGIWRTAEHYFQAMRFPGPHEYFSTEVQVRDLILNAASPMKAKMIAKKHEHLMIHEPRTQPDVALMMRTVKLKTEQHPDLKEKLLATGTARLIEDVSKRASESGLFWGAKWTPNGWQGKNMLGRIWMQLRDDPAASNTPGPTDKEDE